MAQLKHKMTSPKVNFPHEPEVNVIHLAAHDLAKLDLRYAAGVRRVKSPADMAVANDNDDNDDDDDDGDDSDGLQDDDGDGGEVSLKGCQQSHLI